MAYHDEDRNETYLNGAEEEELQEDYVDEWFREDLTCVYADLVELLGMLPAGPNRNAALDLVRTSHGFALEAING